MTAPLYSAQWYRVARLRPRLRPQVQVQRQAWRDQRWVLLSDAASGRQHRINEAAYQFVGRCDGERTVHEVWNSLLEVLPDGAPTQDEVLRLLGQLHESELLQADQPVDVDMLVQRQTERRATRRRRLLDPFAFQLPLADPSKWLARLDPLAQALFRPAVFWCWLLLMALAAAVAVGEWPALQAHGRDHLMGSATLVAAVLLYPLMKALHEAAHALAVRRWGGEVHEVGVGLLFLVPAPYVDASAATAFASRWQRAAVGAAGIAVELTLAAAGLALWLLTQPGLVHDAAFVLMSIGAGSTLLFNGNPLLRFDAYHVMCDVFQLPNLAQRSNAWWGAQLGRLLLGQRSALPPPAAGEGKWLIAYAPLSFAYRLLISLALVLWLAGHGLLPALLAGAYVAVTVLLLPLRGWALRALRSAEPGSGQARLRLRLGLLVATVVLAAGLLPLPHSTLAPAVVWLPEQAQLRPEVDGFVAELPLADGAAVRPGDLLLRLDNPELRSKRDQLAARIAGLETERFQLLLRDANAAQNLALDIAHARAELARADERVGQLEVRARSAGTLVMPRRADLLGAYTRHGVVLGHVLAPGALRVRAAVDEADAHLVRNDLRGAQVRLADAPQHTLAAVLDGNAPAATHRLPSRALAQRGGGPLATDPADKDGLQALQPVFLFDLTLPGSALQRVGGRAWVRFEHGSAPLAAQAWRRVNQLFLQHVGPGA